jgi:hypothetical protein
MSSTNLPNTNDFNIIKNPYYPNDKGQFPYFMLVPEITITTTYKMVPYPLPYYNPDSSHQQPNQITPPMFPPNLNEFYDQIANETHSDQKNDKK